MSRRLVAGLPYLGMAVLLVILLTSALKLSVARLDVPFHYDWDTLWFLMHARTTELTGWYMHNPQLGAPGAMNIHDVPMADNLHLVLIKLLISVSGSYVRGLNLYFLTTFLLAAWIAFPVLQRLGVRRDVSFVASILFACLPYHFRQSIGHVFLAGYYLLPPALLLCVRVAEGNGTPLLGDEGRDKRVGRVLLVLVLCAAVAASGVYYVFFTVFFICVAGLVGTIQGRPRSAITAGLLAGVLTALMLANFLPSYLFWLEHGPNTGAVTRISADASVFALNLSQMVVPSDDHGIAFFGQLRHELRTHVGAGEHMEYLGLFGVAGLALLLFTLVPRRDEANRTRARLQTLAVLLLAGLLLAMTGGFGALFSIAVTPKIRAWERISVFLAFLCIAASAIGLSGLLDRMGSDRRARIFSVGILTLVLLFGLADQLSKFFRPKYSEIAAIREHDREYVRRIEAKLPKGAMVFQLPYCEFPEPAVCGKGQHRPYDHFRTYLVSETLHWSYGAVKGRPAAEWQRQVSGLQPRAMVRALREKGFRGIHLDLGGYLAAERGIEQELQGATGATGLQSLDRRFVFFALEP